MDSFTLGGGFLQTFGKPARESACECERAGGMALGRSVLINEIFPWPQGVNFIEFFNSGSAPVNLKGHYLLAGSPASLAPNARRFQIQQDLVVRPKSFAVSRSVTTGSTDRNLPAIGS